MNSDHWPRISTKRLSIDAWSVKQMARRSLDDTYFCINSTLALYFDHADSFKLDHFDKYFHLNFWLKVNNVIQSSKPMLLNMTDMNPSRFLKDI